MNSVSSASCSLTCRKHAHQKEIVENIVEHVEANEDDQTPENEENRK